MYRRYQPQSIFRELDQLQDRMNRLFDDFHAQPSQSRRSFPAINIWADEESVRITAELPGMESSDIDLNILEDTLTLSGERATESPPESASYHRRERGFGKFSRSLRLPYRVDTQSSKATFKNGVLEITLPRAEEDRPKKIAIKVS